MILQKTAFRAYDIRGVVGTEIDAEGAEILGKAYGTYLQKTTSSSDIGECRLRIALARDGRTHGKELTERFAKGVLSTGIDVVDFGMLPSPMLYFAICDGHFDGGVAVTASHNPKEYNGFKLQKSHAHAIFGDEIQEIYHLAISGSFTTGTGSLSKDSIFEQYQTKISAISPIKTPFKIVIDAGNGITGMYAPQLFRSLGCEVIELFCDVDGTFPNHQADPEEPENLVDLQRAVLEHKADFGLAFDGDGDRIGVVDRNGWILPIDLLFLLLAKDALSRNPGRAIVYDLKASLVVPEAIEQAGGKAVMSRVGHSYVEEAMAETNAIFGGEVSGHLFFAEEYYGFDDAMLAGARFLSAVAHHNWDPKTEFDRLPITFPTKDYKFSCLDTEKFKVVSRIADQFAAKYPVSRIDGVKVDFGDGAWAVVRASNTSPKLNFKAESKSAEQTTEIEAEVFAALRSEGIEM